MKKILRTLSFVIAVVMLAGMLAACVPATEEPAAPAEPVKTEEPKPAETEAAPAETEVATPEPPKDQPFGENLPTAPTIDTPLVVAYSDFSQKFSPFFADTAYDADVAGMTQIGLLTMDRVAAIIPNAIEGETRNYNGTDYLYKGAADTKVDYQEDKDVTVYTATLRRGMKFSDGEPVTIDDVIFTYYTLLDPSYVGSTTLNTYDIIGLQDYQTQTTSDVYDKYAAFVDGIYDAGADHEWTDADGWTKEMQDQFNAAIVDGWKADVQGIIDVVAANYIDNYAEATMGLTPEEIKESDGLKVAFAFQLWGFGKYDKDAGVLTGGTTKKTWKLDEVQPTFEEMYEETVAKYEGDIKKYSPAESATETDVFAVAKDAFIREWGPKDTAMGGQGVPNIAGIKKVDDMTVEVTVKGFSAPAVYAILGVDVTPLHYYGDKEKYDYENNKFGFDYGDLSKQQSLTATPMGAGPYKFVKYDNRVVYFEANENYYRGCPKIKEIQFRETSTAEVASGVQTGTVDAGELSGSRTRFEEVASYNSNGELSGDVITLSKVNNLGYGYVGINAGTVNVAGEPGSDASKDLRRGLATVLAIYRDVANDSYYGEAAATIQYPISNTSWAAPQPTDEGYMAAFSVDVDGNPIYTAEMTPEEKYAAAAKAALGFFERAGYTVTDGKLTAAPEGAKLSYEAIVPGDGIGDHPAFALLTGAQATFATIGMELKINDPASSNVLWDALDSESQEIWTAAWRSSVDPDMYQVYHSSSVMGAGGSESNHYHVMDPELDQLIVDARVSEDQTYRKAIYKQALDIVIDWAVEVPNYQRQNCVIFSTQRINIDTITPDITTFWGWMNDIELLEMNSN